MDIYECRHHSNTSIAIDGIKPNLNNRVYKLIQLSLRPCILYNTCYLHVKS